MAQKYIGLFMFLASTSTVLAEIRFGGALGVNYSTLLAGVSRTVDIGAVDHTGELTPSGNFGFQFGGFMRLDHETWAIDIGGLYTRRSSRWHGALVDDTETSEVRNSFEITMQQFEIPVISYVKIPNETVPMRFGLGFITSYGIGQIKYADKFSNTPGSVVSDSGSQSWQKFGFDRLNFSGLLVFGLDVSMGEKSVLGLDLRAQASLTDYAATLNPNIGGGEKIGFGGIDFVATYLF